MTFNYYPGCTLKNKAKDLDLWARKSAEVLGVNLEEIPDWQCCGGVFTTSRDEVATKLSSVRALKYAKETGNALVTVCSACHNVIKQTNDAMANDQQFADKVNRYMSDEEPYDGSTKVIHYLELLRDTIGFENVAKKVVKSLSDMKIAAYYGCLLLRPGQVMAMDDVENPTILEDFITAIGAKPVVYAMRNECCGGYMALEDPAFAARKARAVVTNAAANGASIIVTACPLCRYNLIKSGLEADNPGVKVMYFTELLAMALGLMDDQEKA